jgi:hypothetical protein
MKLSNLMIVILSIILSAYAAIAAVERRGSNNQGWRDIQLKAIGRNRFLLRRLDRELVVEFQKEQDHARVVELVEPDLLSDSRTGTRTGPVAVAVANTQLGGVDRRAQRRANEVPAAHAPGRRPAERDRDRLGGDDGEKQPTRSW